MTETDCAVILFFSTQGAIKAERTLTRAGFVVRLIPTPRQFSSDCGTALLCGWGDVDAVRAALKAGGVGHSTVHRIIIPQSAVGR
jgi:hypothetical protein